MAPFVKLHFKYSFENLLLQNKQTQCIHVHTDILKVTKIDFNKVNELYLENISTINCKYLFQIYNLRINMCMDVFIAKTKMLKLYSVVVRVTSIHHLK